MAISADDSLLTDLEELNNNVVNLDIAEQMELDGKLLDDVFTLQKSGQYIDLMKKVEHDLIVNVRGKGVVEQVDEDAEFKFIEACIGLLLESVVAHPIDFARVVKKIVNKMDVNFVDLEGLLPVEIIEVVAYSALSTIGKALAEDVFYKTIEACNRVLALDSAKKKVVDFVENRMGYLAPNITVVFGSVVAAKLVGAAGSLLSLEKMSCDDIELLVADLKNLPPFPPLEPYYVGPLGAGYINQCGLCKGTLPDFRIQTYQRLAKKSKLAAHMDSTRGEPTGEYGRSLREEILQVIEEWKKPCPVPVPDPTESEPYKKRRGGRGPGRFLPIRKKPTYNIMKLVNNMIFGIPEKPKEGYGMLGQVGSGGADTMSSSFKLSNSGKQLAGSGIQSN
ncbi:U4/U6 small nuclear ribonucleoprotein Prp31 [Capsicum chacoense]